MCTVTKAEWRDGMYVTVRYREDRFGRYWGGLWWSHTREPQWMTLDSIWGYRMIDRDSSPLLSIVRWILAGVVLVVGIGMVVLLLWLEFSGPWYPTFTPEGHFTLERNRK